MYHSSTSTRRAFLVWATSFSAVGLLAACGATAAPATVASSTVAPTSAATSAAASQVAVTAASTSTATSQAAAAAVATPTAVAAGATGGVITLKIAPKATGSPGALDKQAADLFNQANPGLKLELDVPPSGNYYEKILTEIAAGEPPDAARIDDYLLAPSVARKGIDPLDSYIGADKSFDLGDFDKVALQNGQYQGKQYGMPIELDTYVIFYNATAFKEAGIPLPPTDWTDNSWTWPDFLQICQKLVKQTGGSTDRWGFMYDYAFVSRLSAEVYAQGGTFVDDPLNPSKLTLDNPRRWPACSF